MSRNVEKIKKWLEPPVFPGDEKRNEQARILSAIEQYLFGVLALSAIAVPFLTPTDERVTVIGIILGLLIVTGISRLLLFSGRIEASGIVIAISVWTAGVAVSALGGGVSSPTMFSAVIIAIVFGLLLRQLVGKILIWMSILAGLGMITLPSYGVILPQLFYFSEIGIWFVLLLCTVFSGLAVNYTLQRLDASLKQSQQKTDETVVKSEAMFRAMFDNINDGMIFSNAEGLISFRSPTYQQIDGYSNVEWGKLRHFEHIHPEDQELVKRSWQAVLENPSMPVRLEYRLRHKNGKWVWVETVLQNLLDDMDICSIVLTTRDITERKRFEQAQAEAQAKLEKLFDVLPVGISVLDEKRNIVKQNQALGKILQFDPEELAQGKHVYRKYIRPDGTPMSPGEFASSRVLHGESSALNVEMGVIKEDGEVIWVNVSATNVPFSDWRMVVVTSDITDRKQAELKLRESEERFRSLIEQSSEGIILTNESGMIIEWNRAQAQMTGITQDKAIGVPVWEMQYQLMLPERRSLLNPEMIKAGMQSVFSNGTSPYINKYVEYDIKVDGELRSFLQISFPIKTEKGYCLGNITRDVTENKQVEASLRQHDAEVLRSALEERQRLARELHDSMGQVLGYVSFQAEAVRELYASGNADKADAQLERLASIAQDAHADVREYILDLRTAPTVREPLFETLQNYLDGFTRNYNIRTSLILGEGLDENALDAKAQMSIFRIAQEALSNIRKHADARHAVVLFNVEGNKIRMTIEDDGHGFNLENSLKDNKPHFGLSIMNERVDQLGGGIRFESAHPSGTRVLVEIPIKKEKQHESTFGG